MFGFRSGNNGTNSFNGFNGFRGGNGGNNVETIVSPTRNVVNTTTNECTVRRVQPTHIVNVNRNVTRVENYYPVTQSTENENIVEKYDCGSDLRNPCCKPVKGFNR
ncbi:CotD family spore coat protein [Bacillus halotolerans]|uniref:CotD family spore coat protein n=1 Tax=Bacillus halotolerans TaxID=260554 RepID=UPI0020CD2037|nr:CotD family spore coat protein [Bacillus halotolerans]MCP9298958.1 spore coat protein [Bacillus halotolerans]WOC58939.1 CotD family spore coat protein [Bacillus halotolerans]